MLTAVANEPLTTGKMLYGTPSPTKYRYGTRNVGPAPVTTINPSYEPGLGRLPWRVTVTLFWPGDKVMLGGSTVTLALGGSTAKLKVAVEVPTLVMFSVRRMGKEPAPIAPNEMVAGSSVAATLTASPTLSLPAPTALALAWTPPSVTS